MATNKPQDNGVKNAAAGITMMSVAPLLYLGCASAANYITKPGGAFEKLLNGILNTSTFVATAGSQSALSAGKAIPAMSLVYLYATYSLSSASSASAIAAAFKEGRDNNYPRSQVSQLRGLPLRVHSAHQHLMEVFPAFALMAGLVTTLAPADQHLINLLGFHVLVKLGVFWPSYITDLAGPRGIGHLSSVGALMAVGWKLAFN